MTLRSETLLCWVFWTNIGRYYLEHQGCDGGFQIFDGFLSNLWWGISGMCLEILGITWKCWGILGHLWVNIHWFSPPKWILFNRSNTKSRFQKGVIFICDSFRKWGVNQPWLWRLCNVHMKPYVWWCPPVMWTLVDKAHEY